MHQLLLPVIQKKFFSVPRFTIHRKKNLQKLNVFFLDQNRRNYRLYGILKDKESEHTEALDILPQILARNPIKLTTCASRRMVDQAFRHLQVLHRHLVHLPFKLI